MGDLFGGLDGNAYFCRRKRAQMLADQKYE